MRRIIATGLLALGGLLAVESTAQAQEIQLTGPLAGAPAVRQLRLHRKGRIELAPTVSFTLLDEYSRTIIAGARVQYHLADWLGVGAWGGYGVVHMNTGLTSQIDKVNKDRWDPSRNNDPRTVVDRNASLLSVGYDFPSQLGQMQWVFAPQVTAIPFRGKLAMFQKLFVDTDVYVFAGPAFVGLKERAEYSPADLGDPAKTVLGPDGTPNKAYPTESRMTIAPTFGLGLEFFLGRWTGFGIEYRALPFAWNPSGFDSRGGPPDSSGPDFKVDKNDRDYQFNQMVSVSFSFFLPQGMKSSP